MALCGVEEDAQEIRKLLGGYVAWMQRQETALNVLHRTLAFKAGLGAATCAEIDGYNRAAVSLYSWQLVLSSKATKAGIPLPQPAFPSLFARHVRTEADGTIVADFDCTPGGYADKTSLQTNAPYCPPSMPQSGLGAIGPSAACLLSPWACGVLVVLGAAASGAVLYIGIEQARRLVGAFTGTELAVIQSQMHAATLEADAKRAVVAQNCVQQRMGSLGAAPTEEQTRKLFADCEAYARSAVPVRATPQVASPWAFWIGATVLVGGGAVLWGLGRYLARKKDQPRERVTTTREISGFGSGRYVTPTSVADQKSRLTKLNRNIRKALAERDDAERSGYAVGVKVAEERLADLRAAKAHVEAWRPGGLGAPDKNKLHRIATEISDLGLENVGEELVKPSEVSRAEWPEWAHAEVQYAKDHVGPEGTPPDEYERAMRRVQSLINEAAKELRA